MSFTIEENYLLKALDAYPHDMEAVSENLNYALSYDNENDMAWTLHGKVMAHQLKDYLGAEESFLQALSLNMLNHDAMSELIWLFIEQDRFKEARQQIIKAKKMTGADMACLCRAESVIHERIVSSESEMKKFLKAIASLEEALTFTYNKRYENFLKDEIKRIKAKRKRLEKKQRKQEEKPVAVEPKKKNFSLLRMFF